MKLLRQPSPVLAAFLAACVLLLGFAAQAPRLHALLCGQDHAADHEVALVSSCPGGHDGHEHPQDDGHRDGDHAPASGTHEHSCAVTLFASGCETPTALTLAPDGSLHAEGVASFTELLLARGPLGPERTCGPPCGRA